MKTDQVNNLHWNVINEEKFRSETAEVFNLVAETLTNSLGPFGAQTVIEQFGEVYITKDGWNILQNMHFANPTHNTILQLLRNISAQVVTKVGDGSTSSIIAADQILKSLASSPELKKVRPRDISDILSRCIAKISNYILDNAMSITDKGMMEENIYRLALVSTNGSKNLAEIISKLYVETGNPVIEHKPSPTNVTYSTAIKGYQATIEMLDGLYTNTDDGKCIIQDPLILMFDHDIQYATHMESLFAPLQEQCRIGNRRLVVIGPHYDTQFSEYLRVAAVGEYRETKTNTVVYARCTLANVLFKEQFGDFSIMTGGTIITEHLMREILEGKEDLKKYIGEVNEISIGTKTTFIKGFPKRNENVYELALRDAKSKYAEVEARNKDLNVVNTALYELKKRLAKLTCDSGIIYVGGNSAIEKKANIDLVDDAVKACESAFYYGYNIGGNLSVPIAIKHILDNEDLPEIDVAVLNLLDDAFRAVFRRVLLNKYKVDTSEIEEADISQGNIFKRIAAVFKANAIDNEIIEGDGADIAYIIDTCVEDEVCYDLVNESFGVDIINPCRTDIEIANAAVSIVSQMLSSNQFISIYRQRE